MPDTVPAHLLARLDEEPDDVRSRSWGFVGACLRAGLSDSETLALTLEHKPTKAKYIEGRNDRRLERISAAIKWHHDHQNAGASQLRPSGVPVASQFGFAPGADLERGDVRPGTPL